MEVPQISKEVTLKQIVYIHMLETITTRKVFEAYWTYHPDIYIYIYIFFFKVFSKLQILFNCVNKHPFCNFAFIWLTWHLLFIELANFYPTSCCKSKILTWTDHFCFILHSKDLFRKQESVGNMTALKTSVITCLRLLTANPLVHFII